MPRGCTYTPSVPLLFATHYCIGAMCIAKMSHALSLFSRAIQGAGGTSPTFASHRCRRRVAGTSAKPTQSSKKNTAAPHHEATPHQKRRPRGMEPRSNNRRHREPTRRSNEHTPALSCRNALVYTPSSSASSSKQVTRRDSAKKGVVHLLERHRGTQINTIHFENTHLHRP